MTTLLSSQIEEIVSLICSNSKPNKSLAYSTLSHLQHQSSTHLSSLHALADTSHNLISIITIDISDDDEEIAAQALKCLGFMIYHPTIVCTIPVDDSGMVLDALAKIVLTTKIKSVCNLGMWCISMQQFDASVVAAHFDSLLRAVVYAIDNPIGSLSTTFEAIQAVKKLATQLSEKLRDSSHIWVPSIYRRLLSTDKRERDMSESCLLKIRSAIFPPPAALSKVLVEDMKRNLLAGMKDFLKKGMKVQTMQAWGWFIRLLGSHARRNRHLINDMLKIPEQTFSDHNPQVQIASLVAWEGLVDALIDPQMLICETSETIENGIPKMQMSDGSLCQKQASGYLKSIKLIMTPLVGIMLSKCDISVHASCLNTWCYLLHKLDISINHPSAIELVLQPIFEAVFQSVLDSKTIWSWNFCLDLLDDFILVNCGNLENESSGLAVGHHSSARASMLRPSMPGKWSWQKRPVKWLQWGISQLDFFIKMINLIISCAAFATITPENKSLVCDAALRIFRSLLKGVQMEFSSSSMNYSGIMLYLTTILRFIKKTCEDTGSDGSGSKELHHMCLCLVEAATEELDPSILGSPLYRVALDLKYIENLQSVSDIRCEKFVSINSVSYMGMVPPLVYLIVLYISEVIQPTSDAHTSDLIQQGLHNFLKFIFCSYDPLEHLSVIIGLLYKHVGSRHLLIWITIAKGMKDCINGVRDLPLLKMEMVDSDNSLALCHFLSYPFVVCSWTWIKLTSEKASGPLEEYHVSVQRSYELEQICSIWTSLYCDICASKFMGSASNRFTEDLCLMLSGCIDQSISMLDFDIEQNLNHRDLSLDILSLYSNVVMCVLEKILILAASSGGNQNDHASDPKILSVTNSLGFTARFLKLSWAKLGKNPSADDVTPRVFSALARFVSCLHLKQSILLFVEIMACPLLQWLSLREIQDRSTIDQLQHLWAEILSCLKRSKPPVVFDSSSLELQAPLLEITLDHSESTISQVTICFWNSTYGEQTNLNYPKSLLDLLDKLSRNNQIILHKKSLPFLVKCHSIPEVMAQSYKVTATNNRTSKRVELVEDIVSGLDHKYKPCPSSKRKRLELTEHQKEVRRAQQGRGMDCSRHGPGIRTYTSVDFSQGNEDSQENLEIQNPDTILALERC